MGKKKEKENVSLLAKQLGSGWGKNGGGLGLDFESVLIMFVWDELFSLVG